MGLMVLLAVALVATTPQGHRLEVVGEPNLPPRDAVEASPRYAQGAARVYAKPGSWFTIGWSLKEQTVWPAGQTIYATTQDTTVACDELFAMSPPLEQRVIELGKWNQTLSPRDLWRAPSGRVKLYVRFPIPVRESDIRRIECKRR